MSEKNETGPNLTSSDHSLTSVWGVPNATGPGFRCMLIDFWDGEDEREGATGGSHLRHCRVNLRCVALFSTGPLFRPIAEYARCDIRGRRHGSRWPAPSICHRKNSVHFIEVAQGTVEWVHGCPGRAWQTGQCTVWACSLVTMALPLFHCDGDVGA